ncbi:MAG: 4Fe-4S binding protein [Acidobacteria bacterium]|nr:4Fe-4S binding protein [Acidobacteriota bacterium]
MAKGYIEFDYEFCKGCELCIQACPVNTLVLTTKMNKKGYRLVEDAEGKCTGCASCALVCPDAVITVYRQKKAS